MFTLLKDHKAIWTSPSRVGRRELPALLPAIGITAAVIPFDRRIVGALPNTPDQVEVSRGISNAGTHYALGGFAASYYLAGRIAGNRRARETGLIAVQAVAHTHAVVQMLKFAAGRERPDYGDGQGRFWHRQQSFPSGHSATTWAVATVFASEYRENKWLRYGIYAAPLVISASRLGARRHFLSDSIAGGVIGHLIGRYLYEKHHDPALDGAPPRTRTRALPMPGLHIDAASRTYGVSLSWQP